MTTLIAIDGDYFNRALRKKASSLLELGTDLPENMGKPRLRIDFSKLSEMLAYPESSSDDNVFVHYYTEAVSIEKTNRVMGRVVKYWHDRGWGFIAGTDAKSYFFHNQDLTNKRDLRQGSEERYPHPTTSEFSHRIRGKVVSFEPTTNGGKVKAEGVRLEQGSNVDRYYQLRKEPFLEMLKDTGYDIIRCQQTKNAQKGKDKSVDCRIIYDSLRELQDEDDRFILVSDDSVFITLLQGFKEDGVATSVIGFKSPNLEKLAEEADTLLLLDDHLDEIQLEYEDDEVSEDEGGDYDLVEAQEILA